MTLLESTWNRKFWERVSATPDGCWLWLGKLNSYGDRPSIAISPVTIFSPDEITNHEGSGQRRFEVVVEGMQEVTSG